MLKVNKRHDRARHELFSKLERKQNDITPTGIYLLKLNNRNTRTRCGICSKLTIKIPERRMASKMSVCNNCSNLLTQLWQVETKIDEKLSDEHVEKINIKTVVIYSNMFLCRITVYLENSRLWDQIWPKEVIIKILRNRHWIYDQHNVSNSCANFDLIWRIINFGSKFAQKVLHGGALRQSNQIWFYSFQVVSGRSSY